VVEPDTLFDGGWQPDGAVWYAHACCSGGSDQLSLYAGLVEENSPIGSVLRAVTSTATQFGARTAPLPRRLLGAERPARAFIGHVEPTFDWTLRNRWSGQYLTDSLTNAMYEGLYRRQPVGLAFREWYKRIGVLSVQFDALRRAFNQSDAVEGDLLFCQLAQRDVQSMVILGDPTVSLPR